MDNTTMTKLQYSHINACWFLTFGDSVLETFENRTDAVTELRYRGLKVDRRGLVSILEAN